MLIVIGKFDLNTERRGEEREEKDREGQGGREGERGVLKDEAEEYLARVRGFTGELQFYIFPGGGSGVSLDYMKQQNTNKNNKLKDPNSLPLSLFHFPFRKRHAV